MTTRTPAFAFAADILLVLVFVLVGRASHDEDPILGALVTLWPFAAGLIAGWLVVRGWRRPLSLARVGLPVWAIVVVVGMVLRAVTGQGLQVSFVIVASIVLAVFLIGWRAIAMLVLRRRRG